ncbi:hypothetical protein ACNJ8R_000111 [Cronobacter sakazakii]|uniref:hypothetical protein n=1 Tax=Bacteria TaxID=2 RepID=UPI00039EE2BA|nr:MULTISPECIES: hypothetical protein [Enterobacteriaceae]EKK5412380.1 hypothetical protein [Enterobacter cloacae]EIX1850834.1 hypothetical protein [Cronobacter sakazakii]EJG0600125.1 hypothetical protein [Cronobacter sakazakii]EJV9556250.1 hypothetical protein [Cronobacter sakazakii]EJV9560218.1 hypothetical protein [Cronobacter sakazakii]
MEIKNNGNGYRSLFSSLRSCTEITPPCKNENVNNDIIQDFNEKCDNYIKILKNHTSVASIERNKYATDKAAMKKLRGYINTIYDVRDTVSDCLEYFLSGDIQAAYDLFDETFNRTSKNQHLKNICIDLNDICNHSNPLYRVRKSEKFIEKRNELFHIPFKLRHLVNAQRYSVAGLPCLYLGTSLYICWQEMGKPDFDKLYISAFKSEPTGNEKLILNFASELLNSSLSLRKDDIFRTTSEEILISYLCLWPLIIACNYIKTQPDAAFTQEYIIPNILMQWISRKEKSPIIGIAYRSTKITSIKHSDLAINVVIPPKATYKQMTNSSYCPTLIKTFTLTKPISWQLLKTLDYPIINDEEADKAVERLRKREIQNFHEDLVRFYPITDFRRLEKTIDEVLPYEPIEGD